MRRFDSEFKGSALVFLAGALWGFIGLFVKEMSRLGASATVIGFLRMAFAFAVMAAVTLFRGGPGAFRVDRRTMAACALLGIVCHGVFNVFYSLAVTLAGVSVSAVLLDLSPVFTLGISALFFRERLTGRKLLAAALAVLGCALAATGGRVDAAGLSVLGLACGVGAGFCYALTPIFGRLAADRMDPFVLSAYTNLFAALTLLLWARPWRAAAELSAPVMVWGFFYGLIPTALAYLLYYPGVRLVTESSRVPVLASMEAVVAVLVGVLVYREALGAMNLLGIALVLLSIAVLNPSPKKHKKSA